jgi:predicted dehydrogenase
VTKILRIATVGAGYFSEFHLDAWSWIEGVRVADEAGILLVVHENFRFMPWFRHARRLAEAGRLGRPHALHFRLRPGDGQGPGGLSRPAALFPKDDTLSYP